MKSAETPEVETRDPNSQAEVQPASSSTGDRAGSGPQPRSSVPADALWAPTLSEWIVKTRQWFDGLPSGGKVLVLVLGAIVGFSTLRTVLQLITSIVSLAVLVVVFYGVYKLFMVADRENSSHSP